MVTQTETQSVHYPEGGTAFPSHNTSTGPMYSISISWYFHWSHVLSGGYPSDWLPHDGVHPGQVRWGTPTAGKGYLPQPGIGYSSPDRLCLDRLCRGWYASCGFPQEDFLVMFPMVQIADLCVGPENNILFGTWVSSLGLKLKVRWVHPWCAISFTIGTM